MSKLVKTMLISLVIIILVGVVGAVIVLNVLEKKDKDGEQSIDEIVEYSYQTPEITTDLSDGSFVRIQFQIITDGKHAREELSKREFQVRNILIKELAKMDEQEFKTGLSEVEDTLKLELNELMTEGTIQDVYTINKILQ
ncbi:flagellar basal body-associated protein FliL [Ornithinibacillus sp. BX22]|uniref:Flagellar protein FliL n=2 Tax=Ornithinibacillus TaxID=484508 RepID=A0A923L3U2_9BACI|nr:MULTISPECIES: flagellar basal body-associated protein FliL [Ornithinibacillus]MBC5635969.1 flagellar basal body-associated protein FliL [Ornithinibacillus hominis]MBS3680042.1 flagellar basal body-associated protein FliL [Ornithinibacillus massiliensis]